MANAFAFSITHCRSSDSSMMGVMRFRERVMLPWRNAATRPPLLDVDAATERADEIIIISKISKRS